MAAIRMLGVMGRGVSELGVLELKCSGCEASL